MSEPIGLDRLSDGERVAVAGRLGLVWVTGSDAVSFLDGLLSQNVAALPPGATSRSLLLAPNGKLRATLFLLRGHDRVGLVCDAGSVDTVISDLARFKIRVAATIEQDSRTVYEIWGADAEIGDEPAAGSWTEEAEKLVFRMPLTRHDLPRLVVVGPAPDAIVVASDVISVARIEAGEPVMGVDLDDRTIPQEGVDVKQYVDFTKGCYLGQELVARIDSRGHVNRHLVGLHIDGGEVPAAATPVASAGNEVGIVTSAVWSGARGLVVALGMLRVEIEPGEEVTVGDRRARVVSLPMSP